MIYLDNAATSGKKPPQVINATVWALRNLSANPGRSGHKLSMDAAVMIYNTRSAVKDFFGADSEENVAFTQNCTHSANCILKGILRPGDHVVISNLEHNAVMRPLEKLKSAGVAYDIAQVVVGDDNKTVENFSQLIRPNTKLIFCTHASNVTGTVLPIAKIGQLCRMHGIKFAVDAAQTAGILDINMQEMNIDFLCVAPHKGLYAPTGIGILIARSHIPFTVIEGGTGTDSLNFEQPQLPPERFESGTVNVPGIAGISAGIKFVKQHTTMGIYKHEMMLIKRLYKGFKDIPTVVMYTDINNGDFAPVLSFNVKGRQSGETASFLADRGIALRAGLHCASTAHKSIGTLPGGTVRVSPGMFNSAYDIDYLIKSVKNYNFDEF